MPKNNDTRKQRAKELLERLERGPATSFDVFKTTLPTDAEINRQYRLWAQSWIIPEVKRLIPELKEKSL